MQSKMTEREFKNWLSNLFETSDGTYQDDAAQVAREAGLEFAPEPVKLPERLEIRRVARTVPMREVTSLSAILILAPAEGCVVSEEQRDAFYKAAVARYAAYPGLREAAERAVAEIEVLLGLTAHRLGMLESASADLSAELAKGPK